MKDLLIYIPTYNRAIQLMSQIENLSTITGSGNVTVYVSDNNSTGIEYTSGQIKKTCEGKGIVYSVNPCNLGANPNILNGFIKANKAEFKYLWILSDDDSLKEAAPEIIQQLIKKTEADIILFHKEKECIADSSFKSDFINEKLGQVGLISEVIYKTSFINDFIVYGYDYLPSCFPHLAILISSALSKPYISIQYVLKRKIFMEKEELPHYPEGLLGYSIMV